MIDNNSFEQAIPLASIFAAKGIKVIAVPGTPMEKLVTSTELLDTAVSYTNDGGVEYELTDSDARGMSESSDNESHNAFFDQTVDLLSKSVAAHINNAKNVVSPLVVEASEKIVMRMKTEIEAEPSYKIIQLGLPEPMKNDSFKEAVLKASGGIYADPEKYLKLAEKSPQEILELMLTGSNDFDEKIKLWFAAKGDVFFDYLWRNSFMDAAIAEVKQGAGLLDSFTSKVTGTDYALGVYLLARKLLDVVPENTSMTLADYNKTVGQYLEVAAVKLDRDYQGQEANAKAGSLVLDHNERAMEVYVNEDTYVSYIQGGGKNEIIFGALVENVVPYLVGNLAGKEQEFLTAWERYTSFSKNTIKSKAFVKFKEICGSVLLAQFSEPTDIEKEREEAEAGLLAQISQVVQDYVSSLSILDMNDPYTVALKAVAEYRFHYTNAYKFLSSINEICKENPAIDVREAALIATVEYTTDYLVAQMKLV